MSPSIRPGPASAPPGVDLVTQAELDAAVAGAVPVYNVTAYGAAGDGTTEDYTAVMAAVQAAYDAGGGVVYFPAGTYRISTAVTMPSNGATPCTTPPITLLGDGPRWSGRSTTLTGGSVLDLRASDTYGKVKTNALGLLRVDGLTLTDTAGTSTPFLYTTNGTLHVAHCSFVGTKTSGWDQDAIILGGTTATEGGNGWDDGFQGYGTIIEANYFQRVRRAVYGRKYCNGTVIRDNTVWNQSGYATGAPIELDGSPSAGSNYATGNTVTGNLLELANYKYGIEIKWGYANTLIANHMFDAAAGTMNDVYLGANSLHNTVVLGTGNKGYTDAGAGNTVVTQHPNDIGKLQPFTVDDVSYDTTFRRLVAVGYGATAFRIQPLQSVSDSQNVLDVLRSAAEGSYPGAIVYRLFQSGSQTVRGSVAGNITYQDASGTDFTTWTGGGRIWAAAGVGGNMQINSGTGGSYLTLRNYGVKLTLHDGTGTVTIKQGTGSPEGVLTANAGSLYLRTDGGANTTLYIKESGTGNTGWVAK